MFNEHEMIKNLIFWQPPENVKIIWADNLKNILTSTNKTAPKGWLRNLLSPLGSKKGIILSNSEKEMIYHLRTLLQLTSVKGLNWEISMMWGVSVRTIRRLASNSVSNSSNLTIQETFYGNATFDDLNSPQSTKKRKEDEITPIIDKLKNRKQPATHETPNGIKALKASTMENFRIHSMISSVTSNQNQDLILKKHNKETQTSNQINYVKKKRRKKTVLNIHKPETTIKILVKDCDLEKIQPAFKPVINISKMDDKSIVRSAKKIGSLIAVVCDNNPSAAASVLVRVLNSEPYLLVKNLFEEQFLTAAETIVRGIQSFIADHSNLPAGGTRWTTEKNAIDAVVLASVWNMGSDENMGSEVARAIQVRRNTIFDSIQRALEMKEKGERFRPRGRKIRKDNIQEAAYTYIQKWQHSDENTRIDTNTWREQVSINPFTNEKQQCSRRVWSVTGAERNYELFKNSMEYKEFQNMTIDVNGTIGLTTFEKYLCPCTRSPTAESCVDPLISEVHHLISALREGLKKFNCDHNLALMELLGYDDFVRALQKGRAVELVEACCCPRREVIEFKIDDSHPLPRLIPFACGNGSCSNCGLEKRYGDIFQLLESSEIPLKVHVWEAATRQGIKASGKQNMQLELTEKEMKLCEMAKLFQKRIKECIPHIIKIEWINAVRSFDIKNVGPSNIVIMTDFAATLDLKAIEKVNSSVDAHAFLVNYIVISNRRDATVQFRSRNGEENFKSVSINDCDVLQYFGSTMSKGKKNDYVTHNACLKEIIKRYIKEFEERGQKLSFVILWTDNCPNQYKCKENFVGILKIEELFGILVAHCFAIKDNFKGVWDGAGKVVKNYLWRLEQQNTRSATAFECFKNTKNEEFEFDDRETWRKHELAKDPYLLQRKTFTYTRRIIGYVVDNEAEYNTLSLHYPGSIVFADRREVLTLTKAVPNTTKLHQVACCLKTHGGNYGFLNLQQFPCRCTLCRDCLFSPESVIGCPFNNITKALRGQINFITLKKHEEKKVNSGGGSDNNGDIP